MTDKLTKEQRSYCMSRIRAQNTLPEIKFRKFIWKKGTRGYRIKNKISGKPDLYFPRKKVAVFLDGCFWHKCPKCFVKPKSKNEYWDQKIENNMMRDKKINAKLRKEGITVIRIWEHDIKKDLDKCYLKLNKKIAK
jgi:DNA mismatch endonuclease (patch repair protein)